MKPVRVAELRDAPCIVLKYPAVWKALRAGKIIQIADKLQGQGAYGEG